MEATRGNGYAPAWGSLVMMMMMMMSVRFNNNNNNNNNSCVMQAKDTQAREEREVERVRKIRDIRAAEKQAAPAQDKTASNAHWVSY